MKTYYKGFVVPCIPKKEWGEWMSNTTEPCPTGSKMDCVGVCCDDCIYSISNADVRKEFYDYWYGKWKEELPELSEKVFHCPDCPKDALYLMSDAFGDVWAFDIPLSFVRTRFRTCRMVKLEIRCKPLSIIMRPSRNKASCESCANYEPKGKLPRLTKEVFAREDCPKWANWAAVDADGRAFWYEVKPDRMVRAYVTEDYKGELITKPERFDASDWEHSLIERPKKPSCEDCKNFEPKQEKAGTIEVSMLNWPTGWKYSASEDHYYHKYDRRHAQQINFATDMSMVTGGTYTRVPSDVLDMPCPLK